MILFAAPGFYHGAQTIDDLVDFVVARILDQLGVENTLVPQVGRSDATSPERCPPEACARCSTGSRRSTT